MQQVQKLDEVPGVLAGTFLRSGLPAAVVVFRQAVQLVLVLIQAGRLVCCGVLLAIVHADADDPVVVAARALDGSIAEHIVNKLVHADAETEPEPSPLALIHFVEDLSRLDQLGAQPLRRHVPVVHMDVDAVRALLHLPAPDHHGGVGVLRRVVEVEHLEAFGVASDEGRLDVLELVLAFAVCEELADLIQQHDLDGLALVDDALGVVNAVGSSEVDGVAVWLVCDFPTIFAYISGLRSLKSPQFSLSAFNASRSKVLTSTPSSPPGSSAQRAPVLSVIKEEP